LFFNLFARAIALALAIAIPFILGDLSEDLRCSFCDCVDRQRSPVYNPVDQTETNRSQAVTLYLYIIGVFLRKSTLAELDLGFFSRSFRREI
jgi:hypothetical protein